MTDTSITTVMGPGEGMTTSNGNTNNAARFGTMKTDKMRYQNEQTKRTTMIRKLSKVDNIKFKGILDTISIMVYMN